MFTSAFSFAASLDLQTFEPQESFLDHQKGRRHCMQSALLREGEDSRWSIHVSSKEPLHREGTASRHLLVVTGALSGNGITEWAHLMEAGVEGRTTRATVRQSM
jgi:hypothetical protein